jgi:uncharacterized protein (DUF4415 family)
MEHKAQNKSDWQRSSGPAEKPGLRDTALPEDEFFRNTDVHLPKKQTITIRVDTDVLDWLKRQGRGYQTRINKLLRSYMKARIQHSS